MEAEEEEVQFKEIALLKTMGIAEADIKKMIEAGFNTVDAISFMPRKNMLNIKGISEAKLDKIMEAAAKLCKNGFVTASKYSAAGRSGNWFYYRAVWRVPHWQNAAVPHAVRDLSAAAGQRRR